MAFVTSSAISYNLNNGNNKGIHHTFDSNMTSSLHQHELYKTGPASINDYHMNEYKKRISTIEITVSMLLNMNMSAVFNAW